MDSPPAKPRWQDARNWLKKQGRTVQGEFIGGVFVIIGVLIGAIPALTSPFIKPETFGTLELVDVELAPSVSNIEVSGSSNRGIEDDGFQIESNSVQFDIKVRNTGAEVAFLNRAELRVEQIWHLSTIQFCCGKVLPSANYDISVPLLEEAPFSVSQSISQAVSPNNVDRFTITIGSNIVEDDVFIDAVVLTNLVLVFNGGDELVASDAYLFAIENIDSGTGEPMWEEYDTWEDGSNINQEEFEEIHAVDAIRSERIEQILQTHDLE